MVQTLEHKIRFSKITYRQYIALSYIFSKYTLKKSYPDITELKEKTGFHTDRMLKITLDALEDKGFLKCDTGLDYKLNDDVMQYSKFFVEPLILIKDYTSIQSIKQKVKNYKKLKLDFNTTDNVDLFKMPISHFLKHVNNNLKSFHRWYEYLADFPPSLVQAQLERFGIKHGDKVFDPFCGSGTTLAVSKLYNIDSIGMDVNPIPVLVSKVKTTWDININDLKKTAAEIISTFTAFLPYIKNIRLKNDLVESMGYIEFHQWLKPKTQNEVILMKHLIGSINDNSIRQLFNLILIQSSTESSNASFCPGTSFYPFRKKPQFYDAFLSKLKMIIQDLTLAQRVKNNGKCEIFNHDCRKASKFVKSNSVDFLFTSPPYPNDMEYTRQTRLDLFLLDYVKNIHDVKKIKKNMVKGSTKLIFTESNSCQYVEGNNQVQTIAKQIDKKLQGKNWGWDYPRMVREYFGDMFLCLEEFKKILKNDGTAILVVGNQTAKNVFIPVIDILKDIAIDVGFKKATSELFRVRTSTLHKQPLNEELLILNL